MQRFALVLGLSLGWSATSALSAEPAASVEFEFGSSALDESMRGRLDALAEALRGTDGKIIIEGHTDSVGPPEANARLSRARAEQVAAALVSRGIARSRLELRALADTAPVASNDTVEGRARNRRASAALVSVPPPPPPPEETPIAREEAPPTPTAAPTTTTAAPTTAPEGSADAPRVPPSLEVAPRLAPEVTALAAPGAAPRAKPQLWMPIGATVVAVAAGTGAGFFFADALAGAQAGAANQAQLDRVDLLPSSRAAAEARAAALNGALTGDYVGAGVLGAAAVTAAVAAVVWWATYLGPGEAEFTK